MTPLDTLGVLVHPGWNAIQSREITPYAQELFRRYDEKIEAIVDEARSALLLVPAHRKTWEAPADEFIAQRIDGMKKALGERMFEVRDGHSFVCSDSVAADELKRVTAEMASKGFDVGTGTTIDVFGESFWACVPSAAEKLRDFYNANVVIPAYYTNMGVRDDGRMHAVPAEFKTNAKAAKAGVATHPRDGTLAVDWSLSEEAQSSFWRGVLKRFMPERA